MTRIEKENQKLQDQATKLMTDNQDMCKTLASNNRKLKATVALLEANDAKVPAGIAEHIETIDTALTPSAE